MKILLSHEKEWGIKLGKLHFIVQYLKDKYKVGIVFLGLIGCNCFLYFLYDVRFEPILYTSFILVLFVLPFVFRDLRRTYRKYQQLINFQQVEFPATFNPPMADTLLEKNYQQVIKGILQAWQNERADQRRKNAERLLYSLDTPNKNTYLHYGFDVTNW